MFRGFVALIAPVLLWFWPVDESPPDVANASIAVDIVHTAHSQVLVNTPVLAKTFFKKGTAGGLMDPPH
jgi:hypothetical protein